MQVAVDSSVLVGLLNPRDHRRVEALALRDALRVTGAELVYFDCVAAEAISTAVRRLYEKRRLAEVEALLDLSSVQVPAEAITWILPDVPRLYPAVLELIRSSLGEMNFNDALIALSCRERDIPAIASFDADFDRVTWLRRLARPEDVASSSGG
jgi:predicted nucleic acid-binding protein